MRASMTAIALAGLTGIAGAAEDGNFRLDTAGDLAALCASAPDHPNHAAAIHMCHGYLVGLHHMHQALAGALQDGLYCLPAGDPPSRNEVVAAFLDWSAARPDMAGAEAVDAALAFAAETYPCN